MSFHSFFIEFLKKFLKKFIFLLTNHILRDMMYYAMRSIASEPRRKGEHMDAQLKRGLLDVCVLTAIKDEDSYGYRIIKDLKPCIELSESTLYTILKRLETTGMLTVRTAEHEGRLRKYYHITAAGLSRIEDFKNEWREVMSIYRFVTKEDEGDE